ncbi:MULTISPECIES: ABC transporter substrate-binding protein [unclassified Pseudomonas]|uniref:ABC transporter substrate-binding protein n=1 Tax=unclassified Pseudomonas TaxID=196821 RepID=UPI00244B9844|nr:MULTISPECIES: ABC transporter substrate-binding protein [unclassified Pseudomonas]MDG9931205.1 ABC transporter substrate-binding protein [Pseudomonas sp. GD04042]MDH0485785.1 ABC transporter substrate-binding protein [Pseudomonas sp. GD04015]MDH0607086.1 ABC transporter substrate-binding protein [Pseudomonas sp. GD03869]
MSLMRTLLSICLLCGAPLSWAAPEDVEVSHWWVSEGERASIDVIRRHMEKQGLVWREAVTAGSGTSRYSDVLRKRVAAGDPPMASQVIGYDIHQWASQGKLEILDDIAREQEWDEVVPYGIQHLSRYKGHWVAAPINAHSTNWLWVNGPQFARLGMAPPDTWPDLLALLDKARANGLIALAIGHEPWEHTLLFESVAVGAGGAEFYRRAFLELDPGALDEQLLMRIFERMSQLRGYLDPGFRTRSWDQATDLVRAGQALLQVQGSWVDGEFSHHGMLPGRDYECFRFPDTQGVFLFNSDQYMLFKDKPMHPETRRTFVRTLMEIDLQRELNIATGAAPARVDVPRDSFNRCGQQAINDLRGANMRRTLMGSIAMGNANPAPVKNAIYQVVSDHLMGRIDDAEAVARLRRLVDDASNP